MKVRLSKTGYEILEKGVLEHQNGNIEKSKRVKLSEMNDEELKQYYIKQIEEKKRRKRIQEEIKTEEKMKLYEIYSQEKAKRDEQQREYAEQQRQELVQRKKDYINENNLGLIGIIGIFIFMFMFDVNVITGIICGFFITMFFVLTKSNNDKAKREIEELETLTQQHKISIKWRY